MHAEIITFVVIYYLQCPVGQEIVAADDLYGGSDRLLSQVIPKTGVVVK